MLSKADFINWWNQSSESQEPHVLDTAWRRYQQISGESKAPHPEQGEISRPALQSSYTAFLQDRKVASSIHRTQFHTQPVNFPPWTATGVFLPTAHRVSIFPVGRIWRSRLLDMRLRPQFALWYRVGVNGFVFNSTRDVMTFTTDDPGELFVANQFPGQFGERTGGRIIGDLSAYDRADGNFELLIVVWKPGTDVKSLLQDYVKSGGQDDYDLIKQGLLAFEDSVERNAPAGWKSLWFLGKDAIYTTDLHEKRPCIHCRPYDNVGILQKDLATPREFKPGTLVSWVWLISSLPSRLREDTTLSHDYLSIAFEFENGRDLTYTWSWELPVEFGYWCPLPTWKDREYHVVLRSGTDQLGKWLDEKRDLWDDYVRYLNGGDMTRAVPRRVTRVWLIAGNRWQRHEGDMKIRAIRIESEDGSIDVL